MTPIGAIEASAFGVAMRESPWLMPAIEALHVGGITLLAMPIAILDLRLLGISRSFSVRRLAARVLPWSIGSFALIVPSGLAMFVAHAGDLISSPVFAVKMTLILLAGTNAGIFHAGAFRGSTKWDTDVMPPMAARAAAAASLLLWASVIACGLRLAST
jgi:hypothetical protein